MSTNKENTEKKTDIKKNKDGKKNKCQINTRGNRMCLVKIKEEDREAVGERGGKGTG